MKANFVHMYQSYFWKMTSHLDPISPLWDPRLKDVSRADSLSGVCLVQLWCFTGGFFSCLGKLNIFFLIIRFSTEDVSASSPEKKSKPTTPTPTRHRSSADWLGLKANNDNALLEDDAKETKTSAESPKAPSSPLLERKSSLTSSHATAAAKVAADTPAPTVNISKQSNTEASKSQKKDDEESDWLAGALSRKKALPNSEAKTSKQEDSFDLREDFSEQVTTQAPRDREDTLMPAKETR